VKHLEGRNEGKRWESCVSGKREKPAGVTDPASVRGVEGGGEPPKDLIECITRVCFARMAGRKGKRRGGYGLTRKTTLNWKKIARGGVTQQGGKKKLTRSIMFWVSAGKESKDEPVRKRGDPERDAVLKKSRVSLARAHVFYKNTNKGGGRGNERKISDCGLTKWRTASRDFRYVFSAGQQLQQQHQIASQRKPSRIQKRVKGGTGSS